MIRILSLLWVVTVGTAADNPFSFKMQEIATDLTVGYAVIVADVNNDKKPDVIVVDSKRVVWYENPTWKARTIISGKTPPDNVCIAALDADRDGLVDFVLGADWKPFNTKSGGTLHWLRRGKTLDDEWDVFPIANEPTIHRIRVIGNDPITQGPLLINAPLMGKDSTKEANWLDGRPVRLQGFKVPKDPSKDKWEVLTLNETDLHVVHNVWPVTMPKGAWSLLTASYEGVGLLERKSDQWTWTRIGEGNQENPKSNRGASEIKIGFLNQEKNRYIATIEPWHGNQVVVYTPPTDGKKLWKRIVIDEELRWGHAVWCADLDGDGNEELVIGVRDNPNATDKFKLKCGVRIYRPKDSNWTQWERFILEEGGVAVEDLICADLNADGRPEIIAVGRFTKNARIYWNQK